jgi:hypothetical protein
MGNRDDPVIDVRGQATIQVALAMTKPAAFFGGGKIEKPEIHGFLDFVNPFTGKKYHGYMGFAFLDVMDWMRIEGRGCHRAVEIFLPVGFHRTALLFSR